MTYNYWREALMAALEEMDIPFPADDKLALGVSVIEGAVENESTATGREVWDANWRADNDREIKEKAHRQVLNYVANLTGELDQGSHRIFDSMTHDQKIAMHKLFQLPKFFAKETRPS